MWCLHQQLAADVIGKVFFLILSLVCKVTLDPYYSAALASSRKPKTIASAVKKQTIWFFTIKLFIKAACWTLQGFPWFISVDPLTLKYLKLSGISYCLVICLLHYKIGYCTSSGLRGINSLMIFCWTSVQRVFNPNPLPPK